MPRLGWDMKVGSVAEWLKRDGDRVEVGETICMIAGDKATTELEALDSGILRIPPRSPELGQEVPGRHTAGLSRGSRRGRPRSAPCRGRRHCAGRRRRGALGCERKRSASRPRAPNRGHPEGASRRGCVGRRLACAGRQRSWWAHPRARRPGRRRDPCRGGGRKAVATAGHTAANRGTHGTERADGRGRDPYQRGGRHDLASTAQASAG